MTGLLLTMGTEVRGATTTSAGTEITQISLRSCKFRPTSVAAEAADSVGQLATHPRHREGRKNQKAT